MLVQCWPVVCDADPALIQHWVNVFCSLESFRAYYFHPSLSQVQIKLAFCKILSDQGIVHSDKVSIH